MRISFTDEQIENFIKSRSLEYFNHLDFLHGDKKIEYEKKMYNRTIFFCMDIHVVRDI